MQLSIKSLLGSVLLAAMPLMFTSCEGALDDLFGEWDKPSGGGSSTTETSISISPTTLALEVGETGQLTATVNPAGTAVTWSSDKEAYATVDANGLVTAVAAGTATITAQAGDKSATCTITVTDPYTAKQYKWGKWNDTDKKVDFTKKTAASDPIEIANGYTGSITSGWYTVTGDNVSLSGQTLTADVHLILCDGAKLTINGKLDCNTNHNLYIYGQKKGDGKLIVSNNNDGISGPTEADTFIEIHGGEITADVTGNSYGICGKDLKVYGGKITAFSNHNVGIDFTGDFDVYGGVVVATSDDNSRYGISIGTLTVYGGKVKGTGATGGKGFKCKVKSGTEGIKFYFSDDNSTWDDGTEYPTATDVSTLNKRYAKAE